MTKRVADVTGVDSSHSEFAQACAVVYSVCCTALNCIALYCIALYCTVLHCNVCFTVLYCIVMYLATLYCTVLVCRILLLLMLMHRLEYCIFNQINTDSSNLRVHLRTRV